MASDNQGFNKEQLEEKIKKKLTELLQVPSEAIDMNQPMTNYGVDSMMSIELATWASRELGLGITQLEVLGGLTAASIAKKGTLGLRWTDWYVQKFISNLPCGVKFWGVLIFAILTVIRKNKLQK